MPETTTILAAVLLAVLPSVLYLVVLNAIDRYEKEPWTILLTCVGVGAIVAPLITLAIFVVTARPATLPPAFAPGPRPDPATAIIEEVVLGLLVVALIRFVRDEFDDVLDGVIYGAAMGAGFGATESFLYVLGGTGQLSGGTVASLVIAGLNHAFYLAVFGAILGGTQGLRGGRRAIVIVLGIATVAFLHAFHDTLPMILSRVLAQPDAALGFLSRAVANVVNWLGLLMIAGVVVVAWRHEARILQSELYDEVGGGLVSEVEYATITSFGGRLRRQARLLRSDGLGPVMRLRRLYAAEGELAFHKWHTRIRDSRAPSVEHGEALRAEIRRLSEGTGESNR